MEKAEEGGLPRSLGNEGGNNLPSSPRNEGGTPSVNEGGTPSDPKEEVSCVSCICWLIGMILLFGVIGGAIWYFTAHYYPLIYIDSFDVLALKQTAHAFEYNTIEYEVEFINPGSRKNKQGIYYDTLNFTVYYRNNLSSYVIIGNPSIDPFHQSGYGYSIYRSGHFEARGMAWANVTTPAVFRVELTTAWRNDHLFWKGKRHHLVARADIQVNGKGSLAKSKPLIRSNNAGRIISKSCLQLVSILMVFMIVFSW